MKRYLEEPQPGWTDGLEVWRKPLEEKENPLKRGPCPLASGSPAGLCPKSQGGNLLGTMDLLASLLPLFSAWALLPVFTSQINLVIHP